MAYTTVYSPDGKVFEVASRDRADKLLLEEGWTQTPPVKEEEEKPKRKSRQKKKAEVEEKPADLYFSEIFVASEESEDS